MEFFKILKHKERGASLLAYGLMVGLVAVAAIAAITNIGSSTSRLMSSVADKMDATTGGAGGGSSNAAPNFTTNSVLADNSYVRTELITPIQLAATDDNTAPAFLTYDDSNSELPSGLSLSSSGLISGTATVDGSFNFGLTVSDGTLLSTRNFSMTIILPNCPYSDGSYGLGLPLGCTAVNNICYVDTLGTEPPNFCALDAPTASITGTWLESFPLVSDAGLVSFAAGNNPTCNGSTPCRSGLASYSLCDKVSSNLVTHAANGWGTGGVIECHRLMAGAAPTCPYASGTYVIGLPPLGCVIADNICYGDAAGASINSLCLVDTADGSNDGNWLASSTNITMVAGFITYAGGAADCGGNSPCRTGLSASSLCNLTAPNTVTHGPSAWGNGGLLSCYRKIQ